MRRWLAMLAVVVIPLLGAAQAEAPEAVVAAPAFTQEMADALGGYKVALDTVWVLITAFLVFFMNLGFAMVESGLSTDVILAKISSSQCQFDTSPEGLRALKAAHVPDAIVIEMVKRSGR